MIDQDAAHGATVRALYAATARGDWPAAAELTTDDFFVTEADGLPFAGVYRGRNALRDLFGKVMAMMDVASLEIGPVTVGEGHAVALVTFTFAHPAGTSATLAEMFRFRDGKVCEIRPYYFDPAPVIAAVEAKQAVPA